MIADFVSLGLAILKGRKEPKDDRWKKHETLIRRIVEIANNCRRKLSSVQDKEPDLEDVFCMADLLHDKVDPTEKSATGKIKQSTDKIEQSLVLAEFVRKVCHEAFDSHRKLPVAQRSVPRAHLFSKDYDTPSHELTGEAGSNIPGVCLYHAFLSQVLSEQCSPGNFEKPELKSYAGPAIVSLNYDLVVEKKLETLENKRRASFEKIGCFYGRHVCNGDPEWKDGTCRLPLVKLHGSVDWERLSECGCCIKRMEDWTTLTAESSGASERWPMIFPSWQRASLQGTVFAKLLNEARIHLRLASRIVFIGYSIPATDRYIRYLLADVFDTAEMPEIEVANLWQHGEALRHVTAMMGVRAARSMTKNYPEGLVGLVKSKRDPSSVGSSV